MAKTITITQEVKELLYDIHNRTYLTRHVHENTDATAFELASEIQASDDPECGYQIRRSLATAFDMLKSSLSEWLEEDASTANDRITTEVDNNGQLVLEFHLPSNFNEAATRSIADGIHSYLVNYAISDWFAIVDTADAETYTAQAASDLTNIQLSLLRRKRPERPTYE